MCKWKQELQNLIKKDRQQKKNMGIAIKEALACACGKQYFEDVVVPAFREIKNVFEDEGNHVWIDGGSLTIGYGAKVSGNKEYTKEVKYEVKITNSTMKSRLYLMVTDFGPQKEFPIGDEHEIAGDAERKNITDITSNDIIDDFMTEFERYVNKETKS